MSNYICLSLHASFMRDDPPQSFEFVTTTPCVTEEGVGSVCTNESQVRSKCGDVLCLYVSPSYDTP